MYRIDIMTLFPDVVGDMLCESILRRGQERGYIRIECHQIRDYTLNKQRQIDDQQKKLTEKDQEIRMLREQLAKEQADR